MKRLKSRLVAGVALMVSMGVSEVVVAQVAVQPETTEIDEATEGERPGGLDVIVVSGRKRARAEALQEVPISVTALNAEQLERAAVVNLVDVGRLTPNASLQQSSQRGIQNFAIRGMGISGSTPSDEPAVGIFQDGVYWGSNYGAVGELFDLEGVEILRGPQGTLFGRNVTGGAVVLRSARPTQELMGKVMGGVGSHGLVEGSVVLNGGLGSDAIAGRIAVQARDFDGYFTDTNTNSDYGGSTSIIVRPSIRFQPTYSLDIALIGEWYSEEGDPTVTRGVAPNTIPGGPLTLPEREGYVTPDDYWSVSPDARGFNDIEVLFGVLNADWDVGGGVATIVTGYREVSTRVQTDYDGTPSQGFLQGIRNNQEQFSAELRYAREFGDWLSVTSGLYHFDQHISFSENRVLANESIILATNSLLDNDSQALFVEADLTVLPNLEVTVGGRYTREKKVASAAPFGSCSFDFENCTYTGPRTYKGDNFSPKLGVSYDLGDHLLFASVTRGFRSGGFSLRGTPLVEPYDAETVTAYEAGFKSDFLDRFRFNVAVFYNEYKDLQRTVLGVSQEAGVIQSVFNAADATIQGAELEVTAILTESLTLSGNYGYTDADYETFLGVENPEERSFVRVPKHTLNGALDYENHFASGARIEGRLSASYTSSYFYDDPNQQQQDGYTLVDATLAYTTPRDLTFTIYGKNLTETEYASWGSTLGALGQNLFPGAPRTYGIRVSKAF